MKVMLMIKIETYKDETKRKKYYEFGDFRPTWDKVHEGVKYTNLGGWGVQPGRLIYLYEYESMEEFSKVWSNMEFHKLLVKFRNLVKDLKMQIMRPEVAVPPK